MHKPLQDGFLCFILISPLAVLILMIKCSNLIMPVFCNRLLKLYYIDFCDMNRGLAVRCCPPA
jgi:hypothetical protein